jgi:chemotaxis signal transduction protein
MYFIAEEHVLRIVPRPPIERVPGSPVELLGVALDAGVVLPVIGLGNDAKTHTGPLVVCRFGGEALALSGLTVVASGRFSTSDIDPPNTIRLEDLVIPPFDLASAASRVVPGPWAGTTIA